MPNFEFLGPYESDAGLPDGTVVRVKPHDVVAYTGKGEVDGSAFWSATQSAVTVTTSTAPALPAQSGPPEPAPEPLTPAPAVSPAAAPSAPATAPTPTTAPSTATTPTA